MKIVRIVGVPEHFNLPWHLCLENNEFSQYDIDLQWTDVPEGTGKMCELLRNNEADIAVILTEGIVKDIAAGNPSYIVQTFVKSPLIWGIHTDYTSPFKKVEDLQNKKVAISRYGSGSHLMAIVNADKQNWDTTTLDFEVVNTLDNAVISLQNKQADYFMWERFMTKPLVDQKIFKKIAECPTPWPSFVIAVSKDFFEQNKHVLDQILDIVNTTTAEFKYIPSIDKTLASRYNLELEDVQEWLSLTRWSQRRFDIKNFNTVQDYLFKLKLIDKKLNYQDVVK